MNNMLQIIAPDAIESKAIVPIGYVKIPITILDGYNNDTPEHIILKNGSVITASDNIKLSDSQNGVKVDSIQLPDAYKDIYIFPESNGEYCIAVDKYKITNIAYSSSVNHIVINIQKLFDEFSAIEHIGPSESYGTYIKDAILNCDLIDEFPKNLKTLYVGGTNVIGDISKVAKLKSLTTLKLIGANVTGDISRFNKLSSLTSLSLGGSEVTGDISRFNELNKLQILSLDSTKITGSINKFNTLTNLTSLSLSYTRITGDIINLGNLVNLTNIGIGKSGIGGTIESFVQAQRSAGRNSAQITGSSANWGEVTFNGSSTKGPLSWTPTTITMNGVTINA